MMDAPSRRYQDAARFSRAYAAAEDMKFVAQPATPGEIDSAETALGAAFPDSFRWFQLEFGDFRNGPLDIYPVRRQPHGMNIVGINHDARTELHPRLPEHLIAFSDNGGGDYFCFDTSRRDANECPVVWWDHEQDEQQVPAPAAPSFPDWLESELRERAEEERGSLLDAFPYKDWIATWVRRAGKDRPTTE